MASVRPSPTLARFGPLLIHPIAPSH